MNNLKTLAITGLLSIFIMGCGVKKENPESSDSEVAAQAPMEEVSALNQKINQGLQELKQLNDPNISQVYNAINNLTAESTVNDLKAIESMVNSHLQSIRNGANAFSGENQGLSQISQEVQAQMTSVKEQKLNGIQQNLAKMKAIGHPEYNEISSQIGKIDLNALNEEELGQLYTITAKAIQ